MKRAPQILFVALVAILLGIAWMIVDAYRHRPATATPGSGRPDSAAVVAPLVAPAPAAPKSDPAPDRTAVPPPTIGDDDPTPVDTHGAPGAIFGVILNPKGDPAAEADVELVRGPQAAINVPSLYTHLNRETRSDALGKYRFENVSPNDDYIVVANHHEFGECQAGPVIVQPGEDKGPITFRLRDGTFVEGYVRCDGHPIPNATVTISNAMERLRKLRPNLPAAPDFEPQSASVATDANGHYQFDSAPFVNFEISAEADGYSRILKTSQTGFLGGNSRERKIDFDLTLAKAISGTVVDGSRNGIGGAKVSATLSNQSYRCEVTATSDDAGRFTLAQLADGQYFVSAQCEGFSESHQQQVAAGTTDLAIELRVQGSVTGVAVDAVSGAPITAYELSVAQVFAGRGPVTSKEDVAVHDVGGRFEIKSLDPGKYTLEGSADGYADSVSEEFEVTRGQVTSGIRLAMNRGGRVVGRIVDADGNPVANVLVTLRENRTKDSPALQIFEGLSGRAKGGRKGRTEVDGTFSLDLIVPGLYQVALRHQKHAKDAIDDVEVKLNETKDLGTIKLQRGARISGHAYDLNGVALAGATVVASSVNGDYNPTRTDSEGRYELVNLRGGDYTIVINNFDSDPPINPLERLVYAKNSKKGVTVVNGDELTVDLRLTKEKPKQP